MSLNHCFKQGLLLPREHDYRRQREAANTHGQRVRVSERWTSMGAQLAVVVRRVRFVARAG